MVIDFSDLKDIVKQHILDPMDHAFIYDCSSEKESKVAHLLQSLDSKRLHYPRVLPPKKWRALCLIV